MNGCRQSSLAVFRTLTAAAVALAVFGGCASSTKVGDVPARDEYLERYNRAALQAFEKGSWQQAAAYYQKALDRAYVRDDAGAIVDAHFNLAVSLINQRSYPEALRVIRRAKTETAVRGHGIQADFLLLEATVLQAIGDTGAARDIADLILAARPEASPLIRSKTHFLRGVIAAQQGDNDRLREEIASLGQPELPQLRADRYELVGRLAAAEQRWEDAVDAFDNTAALRREDLDYRKMVSALALAAGACEQAGNPLAASNRYLRAGISAALQGDGSEARSWLDRAENLAAAAGDEVAAGQARSYRTRLPSD